MYAATGYDIIMKLNNLEARSPVKNEENLKEAGSSAMTD